jgi:hypothetical protein
MKLIEFYVLVGIGFYLGHQFVGRDIGKDGKEQRKI